MTNIIRTLAIGLLVAGCTQQPAQPPIGPGPFVGLDETSLSPENRQILREASEDFRAVVAGKKPVHAVFDKDAPLPSDGGTTFYQGKGYRLTVLVSYSGFGGLPANAYGPIIKFDPAFAPGNTSEISDIRVYTSEELSKFLER